MIIDALIARSTSLLAPYIRSSLGIDKSQVGYLLGALMVGTLVATLPLSSLLSRVDTRRTFGGILTLIGLGLSAAALQRSFLGLVTALFLVGLPRAALVPLVNRVIAENIDPAKRGSITGFMFAAVPLGGFVGALVLPALSETIHWGAGYGLLAILALAGGIASWVLLGGDGPARMANGQRLNLRAFGSRAFLMLAITYGFYALSLSSEAFITLYLVDVVKISALLAGAFFGLIQLTGIGGRVLWGILADRYFSRNRWWLLVFTNGLAVGSFALLMRLSQGSPYWLIVATMIGFGLSAAASWGILSTLVGDVVEISQVGMATAAVFFLTTIADSGGPVLFSNALRVTGSYQSTIGIYLGIAILTTLAFAAMAAWKQLKLKK